MYTQSVCKDNIEVWGVIFLVPLRLFFQLLLYYGIALNVQDVCEYQYYNCLDQDADRQ